MGNVSSKSITNILMPVKEKNNWKQQRHPIIDDFSRSCVGCHVETTTITHWVSDWWPLTVAKLESSWWQTNSCSPCPDNIPPLCHKQQNVTISQGQTHNQNLYFLEAYTRYVIYMSHTQKESWRLINPTNTKKTKVLKFMTMMTELTRQRRWNSRVDSTFRPGKCLYHKLPWRSFWWTFQWRKRQIWNRPTSIVHPKQKLTRKSFFIGEFKWHIFLKIYISSAVDSIHNNVATQYNIIKEKNANKSSLVAFKRKYMTVVLFCFTWRIRHRLVLQTWSIQGWYIPNVTQLKKMTAILILSNHVPNQQKLKENKFFFFFLKIFHLQ